MIGPFEQILDECIADVSAGESVQIGTLIKALNHRGFGALLLVPCLFELLPTGALPGVPSLCATIILLLSFQVIAGRRHPWIPQKMSDKSFPVHKIVPALERTRPMVRRIDRLSRRGRDALINPLTEKISAVMIIALALTIYPLEFVPFASSIPAAAIALVAVGFILKNGMVLAFGWAACLMTSGIIGMILYKTFLAAA